MLTFIALLIIALVFTYYIRSSPPAGKLYRCVEDGEFSALYERQFRQVDFWGSCGTDRFSIELGIVEYRRITCVSGKKYTRATSDWFKPVWADNHSTATFDNYEEVPRDLADKIWRQQIRITRKVARGLRTLERPSLGFAAT